MDNLDLLVKFYQTEVDRSGRNDGWMVTREWAEKLCKDLNETPAALLARLISHQAEIEEGERNSPPVTKGQKKMCKLKEKDPETWFHIAAHHDPYMLLDPLYAHYLEPKKRR